MLFLETVMIDCISIANMQFVDCFLQHLCTGQPQSQRCNALSGLADWIMHTLFCGMQWIMQ